MDGATAESVQRGKCSPQKVSAEKGVYSSSLGYYQWSGPKKIVFHFMCLSNALFDADSDELFGFSQNRLKTGVLVKNRSKFFGVSIFLAYLA
jgi:hypothetical protein